MKRILLLVPAIMAMLCVDANSGELCQSGAALQDNTTSQTQTPESKEVVKATIDTAAAQKVAPKDSLAQTPSQSAPTATASEVKVAQQSSVKRDSVATVAKPEPPKPRYRSRIIYGGGRDRYGEYTEECAAHVNGRLSKLGVYSSGHSYMIPSRFQVVMNGYSVVSHPNLTNLSCYQSAQAIMRVHRKASDYLKENFDISVLEPGKHYVVNMYYTTSEYMVQFYKEAKALRTNNYATHVGIVYYDKKSQDWVVEHNIHGNVHRDSLLSVLGGKSNPHKYGVTTIYQVTPNRKTTAKR